MSIPTGQAKLTRTTKDLLVLWSRVRPSWRDEVAHRFEADVIVELEQRVRAATAAMQQMHETLQRVRRDCA